MWCRIHSPPQREAALKVRVPVISRSQYLASLCCGFLSRALKSKHPPSVGRSTLSTPLGVDATTLENETKADHNNFDLLLLILFFPIIFFLV